MTTATAPSVSLPRTTLDLMASITRNARKAAQDHDVPTAFGLLVQLDGYFRDALLAADIAHDYEVMAAMDAHEAWREAEADLRADQIASARGEF